MEHIHALHNFFVESLRDRFTSRAALLKQCMSTFDNNRTGGLVIVAGKPGSGKSSLMVSRSESVKLCNLNIVFKNKSAIELVLHKVIMSLEHLQWGKNYSFLDNAFFIF